MPLVADPATTNAAYIEAVYQDALGRPADPVGLNWAAGIINSGLPHNDFVAPLVFSAEADAQFIRAAYQRYLGREADLAGIDFWLGQMQAGARNEAVEAAFLSGKEFYARAGGTVDGWVQAAYQTVLGRAAEAPAAHWVNSALNAGTSLHDLATVLVMSQEAEARTIDGELTKLGMPVDSEPVASLAAQLSAGQLTESQLESDFLSSPEYFEVHTGVPETIVPVPNSLSTAPQTTAGIAGQAAHGNTNVVFVGDSITQLWQSEGSTDWEEDFAPLRSLDAGVMGDTTENVLWRLQHGNLNGISPRLAVVMIGINDIIKGDTASDVATGITSVVRTLQNELPGTKILLLGVLPGVEVAANSAIRQEIDQVNQMIAPLADGQRTWFLDVSSPFRTPDGSLNAGLFQADYVHPNVQGYHVLAQAIAPSVQALSQ